MHGAYNVKHLFTSKALLHASKTKYHHQGVERMLQLKACNCAFVG
jgi:hypothetical protein